MADRYFTETPLGGDRAVLEDVEAHHLLHVMRARAGDEVLLFDGSGVEATARVERTGRSSVELAVLSCQQVDRELPRSVTLGVALPKGDRQKWLVEKLTELGATRMVPLATRRGVAQPTEGALARLRRGVIEASKQCGRNRLMQIDEPQSLADFLAAAPADAARWFAHPGGVALAEAAAQQRTAATNLPVYVAIGPEGGFSDEELQAAQAAGWQPMDLGARILRVETAAVALAVIAGTLG